MNTNCRSGARKLRVRKGRGGERREALVAEKIHFCLPFVLYIKFIVIVKHQQKTFTIIFKKISSIPKLLFDRLKIER